MPPWCAVSALLYYRGHSCCSGSGVMTGIGTGPGGLSVKASIIKLVEAHWVEMEKKGIVPKGK